MIKPKKIDIRHIDEGVLILNLYITQVLTFLIALVIFYIFRDMNPIEALLSISTKKVSQSLIFGLLFGLIVVIVDLVLSWKLPEDMVDDGGINEKIFKNIPIWHILFIAIVVGYIEELLFRGAIQPLLGVWGTSLIFAMIHFRYLKKWVLLSVTFTISLGLGYLTQVTGSWFSSFIAHMGIDFTLGVFIRMNWFNFGSENN